MKKFVDNKKVRKSKFATNLANYSIGLIKDETFFLKLTNGNNARLGEPKNYKEFLKDAIVISALEMTAIAIKHNDYERILSYNEMPLYATVYIFFGMRAVQHYLTILSWDEIKLIDSETTTKFAISMFPVFDDVAKAISEIGIKMSLKYLSGLDKENVKRFDDNFQKLIYYFVFPQDAEKQEAFRGGLGLLLKTLVGSMEGEEIIKI